MSEPVSAPMSATQIEATRHMIERDLCVCGGSYDGRLMLATIDAERARADALEEKVAKLEHDLDNSDEAFRGRGHEMQKLEARVGALQEALRDVQAIQNEYDRKPKLLPVAGWYAIRERLTHADVVAALAVETEARR